MQLTFWPFVLILFLHQILLVASVLPKNSICQAIVENRSVSIDLLGIIIWPPGFKQDIYDVKMVYTNTLFLVDHEVNMYQVPLNMVTSESMEIGNATPVDMLQFSDFNPLIPADFFNQYRKSMKAVYNTCQKFLQPFTDGQHNLCFIYIDVVAPDCNWNGIRLVSNQAMFGTGDFKLVEYIPGVKHLISPVDADGNIIALRYDEESGGKAITMTFIYIDYDRNEFVTKDVTIGSAYPLYYRYRKGSQVKEHLVALRNKVDSATDSNSPFKDNETWLEQYELVPVTDWDSPPGFLYNDTFHVLDQHMVYVFSAKSQQSDQIYLDVDLLALPPEQYFTCGIKKQKSTSNILKGIFMFITIVIVVGLVAAIVACLRYYAKSTSKSVPLSAGGSSRKLSTLKPSSRSHSRSAPKCGSEQRLTPSLKQHTESKNALTASTHSSHRERTASTHSLHKERTASIH